MRKVKPYVDFPPLIEDLMEEAGWNQDELAAVMNITQQTVSHWVMGKREPADRFREFIINLCETYKIDPDEYEYPEELHELVELRFAFKKLSPKIRDLANKIWSLNPYKRKCLMDDLWCILENTEEKIVKKPYKNER